MILLLVINDEWLFQLSNAIRHILCTMWARLDEEEEERKNGQSKKKKKIADDQN